MRNLAVAPTLRGDCSPLLEEYAAWPRPPDSRRASPRRSMIRSSSGAMAANCTRSPKATCRVLTTAQGGPVSDDQNTLKIGARGPTLIEDFHFREKIFHFDHERIPERVVHARGYGAHGFFETYESLADLHPRRHLPARRREDPGLRAVLDGRRLARARSTSPATCAASPSSSTPRRATGTSSATTSRSSSSRTRSSFPTSSIR